MRDNFKPITRLQELLPLLASDDYERLRADIAERIQIQVRILAGEEGIIDGVHRWQIAQELGLEDIPLEEIPARGKDAVALGVALNLARRHLTPEQKREVIAALRARGWTQEKVAQALAGGKPHRPQPEFRART